jgi:hypothetical protein
MAINLDKAKAGRATPKQSQPEGQQIAPQPLALPSQGKVLAMQAIAATKDDIAMINRVMEQRKTITLSHFDAAMAKCNQEIEAAMSEQLQGEDVTDFLQTTETWEDIESAFQALLTPLQTEEVQSEPEASVTDTTIEVLAELV